MQQPQNSARNPLPQQNHQQSSVFFQQPRQVEAPATTGVSNKFQNSTTVVNNNNNNGYERQINLPPLNNNNTAIKNPNQQLNTNMNNMFHTNNNNYVAHQHQLPASPGVATSSSSPSSFASTRSFNDDLAKYNYARSVTNRTFQLHDAPSLMRALNLLHGSPRVPTSPQAGFFFLQDAWEAEKYYLVVKSNTVDRNVAATAFFENQNNAVFSAVMSSAEQEKEKRRDAQAGAAAVATAALPSSSMFFPCNVPTFVSTISSILDAVTYCFTPFAMVGGLTSDSNNNNNTNNSNNGNFNNTVASINNNNNATNSASTAIAQQQQQAAKFFRSFFVGGRKISSSFSNNNNNKTKNNNEQNNNNNKRYAKRLTLSFHPSDAQNDGRAVVAVEARLGDQGRVSCDAGTFPVTINNIEEWVSDFSSRLPISIDGNNHHHNNNNNNNNFYFNNNNNNNIAVTKFENNNNNNNPLRDTNNITPEDVKHFLVRLPHLSSMGNFETMNNRNGKINEQEHFQNNNNVPGTAAVVNGIIFRGTFVRDLLQDVVSMQCDKVSVSWNEHTFTVVGHDSPHGQVVVEAKNPFDMHGNNKNQNANNNNEHQQQQQQLQNQKANLHPQFHNTSYYYFQQQLFGNNNNNENNMKSATIEPVLGYHCGSKEVQATYSTSHFAAAFGLEAKADVFTGKMASFVAASQLMNQSAGSEFYTNNNNNNNIQQQVQGGGGVNNNVGSLPPKESQVTVQINSQRQLRVVHDMGNGVKIVMVIQALVRQDFDEDNQQGAEIF